MGVVSLFALGAGCHGSDLPMPAGQVAPTSTVGIDAGRPGDAAVGGPGQTAGADSRTVDPDPIAAGYPSGACVQEPGLRLIAPLSGSTMTTAHPRLQLDPGTDGVVDVQICRDRACTQLFWQQTINGREVVPPELPPGYWFWRARVTGSTAHDAWTSAWVFRIRHRAAGYAPQADTVAERFDDFNGDGVPDAVAQVAGGLVVYFGGPGAPPPQVIVPPDGSSTIVQVMSAASVDVNGDGFTDLATSKVEGNEQPFGVLQLGSPTGLLPSASQVVLGPAPYPLRVDQSPSGVGDADGDGYGDLMWFRRYGGLLIHGCAAGLAAGPWVFMPCDSCDARFAADLNGDGRADVIYDDQGASTNIFLGAASPVNAGLSGMVADQVFDLDGDGYADVVAHASNGPAGLQLLAGGPAGLSAPSALASTPPFGADFDGDGTWDSFDRSSIANGTGAAIIDFNGDGYDDVVAVERDAGLLVYAGGPSGLSAQPAIMAAP